MDSQNSKKIVIEAVLENLGKVNDFVEEFLKEQDCSPKVRMQLEVVVEEIFSNIANYAYGDDTGKVTIEGCLEDDSAKIRLKFMDHGSPYNPLEQPEPDITKGAEERPVGGLGIFLVKKNVDDISYQHEDGQNILTIVKTI
jgi:anti-sigma regulatory factor (Ser/Thr protein kinase)